MDPSEYDNIARLEDQHWWYRGMTAISLSLLATRGAAAPNPTSPPLRILDAGCGPGGMLAQLATLGQPLGLDLHPLALKYARRHYSDRFPLLCASVNQLPITANHFDLVTAFDVVYHRAVRDDLEALAEFLRVLKPGGWLLIRVPALESLRGAHDRVVHTQRRYTRSDLARKLITVGFQLKRITYANALLFPLIYLQRKFQANHPGQASDVALPSTWINRTLKFILHLERLWLTAFNFPLGVSLFALAVKPLSTR